MKTTTSKAPNPGFLQPSTNKLDALQHKLKQAEAWHQQTVQQLQLQGPQQHLLEDLALCIAYVSKLQKQILQAQTNFIAKTMAVKPKPN